METKCPVCKIKPDLFNLGACRECYENNHHDKKQCKSCTEISPIVMKGSDMCRGCYIRNCIAHKCRTCSYTVLTIGKPHCDGCLYYLNSGINPPLVCKRCGCTRYPFQKDESKLCYGCMQEEDIYSLEKYLYKKDYFRYYGKWPNQM